MNRMLIYPFCKKDSYILAYKHLLKEYEVHAIVLPEWEDISDFPKDIFIYRSVTEGINECDVILLLENSELSNKAYEETILLAQRMRKKIIVTDKLFLKLKNGIQYHEDLFLKISATVFNSKEELKYLKHIRVPVVYIYGLGENCNKMHVQLGAYSFFKDRGYNVLAIGTSSISKIFGIESMPQFLFEYTIPFREKVLMFNEYIYEKVEEHRPDIVIIGVPGGVIPFNNYVDNYFSEIPYILANAVKPDISILNTYFFYGMTIKYLNLIKECLKYKLNSEVRYFFISDVVLNCNLDNDDPEIQTFYVKEGNVKDYVNKELVNSQINVFALADKESSNRAYEQILDELTENIEIL